MDEARSKAMFEAFSGGRTLKDIGAKWGRSADRVRQIVHRHCRKNKIDYADMMDRRPGKARRSKKQQQDRYWNWLIASQIRDLNWKIVETLNRNRLVVYVTIPEKKPWYRLADLCETPDLYVESAKGLTGAVFV